MNHDAARKRSSPEYWYGLLGTFRNTIHLWINLWCVLLIRGMRLIHNFNIRSVSRNLLCIGRYLCVRFLHPESRLFLSKT